MDLTGEVAADGMNLRAEVAADGLDLTGEVGADSLHLAADGMELGREEILERFLDLIVHTHARHDSRPRSARQRPRQDTHVRCDWSTMLANRKEGTP